MSKRRGSSPTALSLSSELSQTAKRIRQSELAPLPSSVGLVVVANRRTKSETLQRKYPGSTVIDVTSKGPMPWRKFSPFYPHGDIPVPTQPSQKGMSVEGIWQGLKCFEKEGVDVSKLTKTDMKDMKRGKSLRRGKVLGHAQRCTASSPSSSPSDHLLGYLQARKRIYLPAYLTLLERMKDEVQELKALREKSGLILLDYNTNEDIENCQKPLSHAGLIKLYIEDGYPKV
ncbi:hypothetical protein DFJ77DRAFT_437667 [Powellomyces hirtus]|nr:hypothetical protein DFJ77DRAFT_437667 [Powellomyces hirtus]